ncbi:MULTISPECIES: serine/threonine-protein kinase [Microbacterium]|uniref:serine/threonine-protein kinase n=1 Tax=Microbacterium TaxID=33882 RepID=UPI001CB6DD91|nr:MULTISPECIES: serine/threonine-protein kinase [Microbacterium]
MRTIDEAGTVALLDGRYELVECVGQGGMGKVYRAVDTALGRTVAVKLLPASADGMSEPDRARNEVRALGSVHHPSLVKLLDARIAQGHPSYLVMEYIDGPTLSRQIRAGAMPPSAVAKLAVDLASGLHAVHAAGLVHRDVTPANVLLAASVLPSVSFHAKLTDFGVALLTDSVRVTTPGMVIGTAHYLAPEQVRGAEATPAADIYALGLVLREALTGERAYPHASGIGAVMARLVEPPSIPDSVGSEWAHLLRCMTDTDPEARPSALEVAEKAMTLRSADATAFAPVGMTLPREAAASPSGAFEATAPIAAPSAAALPEPTSVFELSAVASAPSPMAASPTQGATTAAPLTRRARRRRRSLASRVLVGSAAAATVIGVSAGLLAAAAPPASPAPYATVREAVDSGETLPAEPVAETDASTDVAVVPASTPADAPQAPADTAVDQKDAGKSGAKAEKSAAKSTEAASDNAAPESAEPQSQNGKGQGKGKDR